MKQCFYAVYDKCAEIYFSPFIFKSENEAIRMFRNCILDQQHRFAKNPEDYSLHRLAEWDERAGEIMPFSPISTVAEGIQFIRKGE